MNSIKDLKKMAEETKQSQMAKIIKDIHQGKINLSDIPIESLKETTFHVKTNVNSMIQDIKILRREQEQLELRKKDLSLLLCQENQKLNRAKVDFA